MNICWFENCLQCIIILVIADDFMMFYSKLVHIYFVLHPLVRYLYIFKVFIKSYCFFCYLFEKIYYCTLSVSGILRCWNKLMEIWPKQIAALKNLLFMHRIHQSLNPKFTYCAQRWLNLSSINQATIRERYYLYIQTIYGNVNWIKLKVWKFSWWLLR